MDVLKNQQGSHVVPVLVVMATLCAVIFVGYTVFVKNKEHSKSQLPAAPLKL